jgi:glycerophosphoryl diester phosphodiesterase
VRRLEGSLDAKAIAPEAISATLRRHGILDSLVVYGGRDDLKRLMQVDRDVKRLVTLRRPNDLEDLAKALEPYAFDIEWSILSRELVDRCHARRIKVYSDALESFESLEEYRKAIEMGVDLIQTDHPERILRAIELRGKPGATR